MLTEFSLENLAEYDGGSLQVLFNQAVQRIAHDLRNRPGDKRKRKASVTFEFEPRVDPEDPRELGDVVVRAVVKDTIPDKECIANTIAPAADGRLHFDSESRVARIDPRQGSLYADGE